MTSGLVVKSPTVQPPDILKFNFLHFPLDFSNFLQLDPILSAGEDFLKFIRRICQPYIQHKKKFSLQNAKVLYQVSMSSSNERNKVKFFNFIFSQRKISMLFRLHGSFWKLVNFFVYPVRKKLNKQHILCVLGFSDIIGFVHLRYLICQASEMYL